MEDTNFTHGYVVEGWRRDGGQAAGPYPARLGARWNGYATPYFDRATVERVITEHNTLLAAMPAERRLGLYRFAWDGDTILVSLIARPGSASAEEADRPSRITPTNIDGAPHWCFGFGWRWEEVTMNGGALPPEPASEQETANRAAAERVREMAETLRLDPRSTCRLPDDSSHTPLIANVDARGDVPVGSVVVGTDGTIRLQLDYRAAFPGDAPSVRPRL